MQVIGFQNKSFTFDDGRKCDGYYIFLSDDSNKNVTGVQTERIFLSNNKAGGYIPCLGDELRVSYNKWGKVDHVDIVS